MTRQYGDNSCEGGPELFMGGALGRRTFYLDPHGILRGVTYRMPWRDGENVAACLNTRWTSPTATQPPREDVLYAAGGVGFNETADGEPVPMPGYKITPCKGIEPECGCGFYAYHNGGVHYAVKGPGLRLEGIVEAYGKVRLGTLGFRAEKARIKAILLPMDGTAAEAMRLRAEMERAIRDLEATRDTQHRRVAKETWCYAASTLIFLGSPARGGNVGFGIAAAFATLAVLNHLRHQDFKKNWHRHYDQEIEGLRRRAAQVPDDYDDSIRAMVERYPSVRIFTDREQMEREYPVESMEHLVKEARE